MIKTEKKEKINEEIRSREVRVVGDKYNNAIMTIEQALTEASKMRLDLVEISSNSYPPICKIMDYTKLLYERKQREKLQKQNNKKTKVKEIRFTYNTGDHDFDFKLRHAISFLKDGDKVRAYVMFAGREINYKEQGEILLLKFLDALIDYGKPEALPKLDGKRMWVIISPKK